MCICFECRRSDLNQLLGEPDVLAEEDWYIQKRVAMATAESKADWSVEMGRPGMVVVETLKRSRLSCG